MQHKVVHACDLRITGCNDLIVYYSSGGGGSGGCCGGGGVTYAGGLCSPPTYDLPALISGFIRRRFEDGRQRHGHRSTLSLFYITTPANLLLGGRPDPE